MLYVRHSTIEDLPAMHSLYALGREHMRAEGNTSQWGPGDDPDQKLENDIRTGISYVVIDDSGSICGTFAFIIGDDPTYTVIEDGSWPDSEPYGTIHRIASDQKTKGILKAALSYCDTEIKNIRIDTHADNKTMQAAAARQGFIRAGIIHVEDGTPRIAFFRKTR